MARPRSGQGTACIAADQETGTPLSRCQPGEGQCPPNVDCVGDYGPCNAQCTKTYEVFIERSGDGDACEAATGETATCAIDSPCDDDDPKSMDDICSAVEGSVTPECKGTVAIGGGLAYPIVVDVVPDDGPERANLEAGIKGNLAGVISSGGMTCSMADIKVVAITKTGGRRRTQEGDPEDAGVAIDYTVSVPAELASQESQDAAAAALANPPEGTSMDISIGGIAAGAPVVEPFHTYAWVKAPGTFILLCGLCLFCILL